MAALPGGPPPALLSRLNQNMNALRSAIEGIWIDHRGSAETSHRVSEHIDTLSDNSDAIAELLVDLLARWVPENEIATRRLSPPLPAHTQAEAFNFHAYEADPMDAAVSRGIEGFRGKSFVCAGKLWFYGQSSGKALALGFPYVHKRYHFNHNF